MKNLLILAAVSEGLTGLILVVYPPIVIRLLFDSEVAGAGVWMSRLAGMSLIALGVACWPDHNTQCVKNNDYSRVLGRLRIPVDTRFVGCFLYLR